MSFATATRRANAPDLVNRRLASGFLLSIILHALLLSLQFGMPGLGLPSPFTPPPLSIVIMPAEPPPPPVAASPVGELPPLLPAPASTGMRVIAQAPAPTPPKAVKPKRVKPRRISRPTPPRELVESPTRVIAQDQHLSDNFVVPMPQPETVDPKDGQDGSDDGAQQRAALSAEDKRKAEEAAALVAEAIAGQERLSAANKADELRMLEQQRRSEQELAERKQADERAALLHAEQLAARERSEQVGRAQMAQDQLRRQQADRFAARQKTDELALKQRTEELALRPKEEERQRAEQLARQKTAEAALQQAEQAARQQAEQVARQQAEQVARQQADQVARQQAEQVARQQADQVAANGERERAAAAAMAGAANHGAGGTGVTVPKNLLGSDAGNRVRELARGIDLLRGAPPLRAREDDDRSRRRVVVGGAEQDVPLRMYVDSFRQKIERNGGLAFAPAAPGQVRVEPLVSVAIRSDGSVEEVTIVRSSGHADTDNAVRRIIGLNARYSAFPPNIATRYDVIEIRRIWRFTETLRLLEELR